MRVRIDLGLAVVGGRRKSEGYGQTVGGEVKAELVTKSEYAARRGCAPSAVTRALKEGRITAIVVDGRSMIDPEVADIQWGRNTRRRADSRPAADAAALPHAGTPPARDSATYDEARRRREMAEAALAELKLAELRGELVRADEWVAALARRCVAFREGLLQIPSRLSAQLAAESDEARVHATLDSELRQVMFQLTDN